MGGRSIILNHTDIGNECVIAECVCVVRDVSDNSVCGTGKVYMRILVKIYAF